MRGRPSILVPMEKKKLEPLTKVKIMLAVEYAIFVVVFAVLGVLFLTEVIKVAEWKRYLFTYVTLAGTTWILVDFFWTLFSPKRRQKQCLLDKIMMAPVGFVLLPFDIYAITQGCAETLPYRFFIGGNLCYFAAVYAFLAIYHWFHPIPAVIEAALEEEKSRNEVPTPPAITEEQNDEEK